MTIRCDHCRGSLGLTLHRYWRMRFCSARCVQAYQQRFHDLTMVKIKIISCDVGSFGLDRLVLGRFEGSERLANAALQTPVDHYRDRPLA
jgi:hypothetical protein